MSRHALYAPIDIPKPFAPDLWIVDGPLIRFYGVPFSTRMTLVRLSDGRLVVHSPIAASEPLIARVQALGPIRAFVAPNQIHYAAVGAWQAALPGVETWAAPGVSERAAAHKVPIRVDRMFGGDDRPDWAAELEPLLVTGSRLHHEVVFFHHASKTLILTDLVENFEPGKLPWYLRGIVSLLGMTAPDGRMPPDMQASFRRNRALLRAHVETMLSWKPEKVVLAHGLCFEGNAEARLRRAFRHVLRNR